MPLATDGIWTPEEAEAAFIEFGNLFLQIVKLHRLHGLVNGQLDAHHGQAVVDYVHDLPTEKFTQLFAFLQSLPEMTAGLLAIAQLDALLRHLEADSPSEDIDR